MLQILLPVKKEKNRAIICHWLVLSESWQTGIIFVNILYPYLSDVEDLLVTVWHMEIIPLGIMGKGRVLKIFP